MQQALDLASQSVGQASPNPNVGALLVDDHGAIIGRGFHTYAGVKHAEVLALEQAGPRARGATLYINLEPCSHQGRTGPCADALIAAGIARVVASIPDPNPAVSGRGFDELRAAGITVDVGLLAAPARYLNEAFAHYIRHRSPLVTLKAAMSLDGQIAASRAQGSQPTAGRAAKDWITGEAARTHVQRLRHAHDAILTGIGTILADDPLLTDRSGLPRRRKLLRVVLDSDLRLPLASQLVKSTASDDHDVLVFCTDPNSSKRLELEQRGVRVEEIPRSSANSGLDLASAFRRLGELEVVSVMCEGGSRLNFSLLASGQVHKAFLYYAPKFLLSRDSVPFAGTASPGPLTGIRLHDFGGDFAVEGYWRDPYAD